MTITNINYCWAGLIIEELVRLGADYFCIAPGSRSSPLTVSVANHSKLKSLVHFDERGLSFHAMGYASATHKPAVLICTSGTAAANFFPAVIEASKKKVPLIVLTADRPAELRQTGAVQTIDQVGLFGRYSKYFVDLPCPDLKIKPEFVLTTIDQAYHQATKNSAGVVHINCMLREPLAPVHTNEDLVSYTKGLEKWDKSTKPYTCYLSAQTGDLLDAKEILSRINSIKNGLIVVGKISPLERKDVLKLSERLAWPIFPDLSSGLRLGFAHPHLIHYFDQILLSSLPKVDGILHLGGRMTSKRYYDMVEATRPGEYITVLNHSLRNDPTHQVTLRVESSVKSFCKAVTASIKPRQKSQQLQLWQGLNKKTDAAFEKFFSQGPLITEPGVARLVSQLIPKGTGLFLSNSMPIRDMEFFADFKKAQVIIGGNRGASGIDGIIASASGFAKGIGKPVTLMVGDLAALHDLNSLAILKEIDVPIIMVVINNSGGGIFSFLPIAQEKDAFEKYFATPHGYTFANAAAMFELRYAQPMDVHSFMKSYRAAIKSTTSTILEVMTSRQENLKTHKALQSLQFSGS